MKKSELLFYEVMNYPVPKYWEFFSTKKIKNLPDINTKEFSRNIENPLMPEYRDIIQKYQNIFKKLPRIQEVYLCNSLSFNSINQESDIDLFIITKKWSIRKARFVSAFTFFFLWIKRSNRKIQKRFCLSFYISEDSKNLYNISIRNTDIYLAYWLAHLVPLYQANKNSKTIYQKNSWLFFILPNLKKDKHLINIWTEVVYGKNKFKEKTEKYISWIFSKIVEYMIKTIRIPILLYKSKKLGNIWKDIIFNDKMLKFHKDERKRISLLYRSKANNPNW